MFNSLIFPEWPKNCLICKWVNLNSHFGNVTLNVTLIRHLFSEIKNPEKARITVRNSNKILDYSFQLSQPFDCRKAIDSTIHRQKYTPDHNNEKVGTTILMSTYAREQLKSVILVEISLIETCKSFLILVIFIDLSLELSALIRIFI